MKKILLSLSLLLGTASLSAQQEFAPIGAVWHYNEYPFFFFPFAQIGYYQIESVADTLIQGRMCRKLIKNHPVLCTGEHLAEFISQEGDTVYYYNWELQEFGILYNFSALPGDMWLIRTQQYRFDGTTGPETDTLVVAVDSVSEITINNAVLKRQFVSLTPIWNWEDSTPRRAIFTEGTGAENYLLYQWFMWVGELCDTPYPGGLRCYYDPAIGLYETGAAPWCDWVGVSARESVAEPQGIRLFPNPAARAFTIENLRTHPVYFDVFDGQGRAVLRGQSTALRSEVGTATLPPGMYHIAFREGDRWIGTLKLMIVR